MAELQEKFTYDDDALNALERSISLERLAPYSGLAQGNRKYAVSLYEWNTRLSEALYGIIQGFEVTLRNAVHDVLKDAYKHESWYDSAPLKEEQKIQVEVAKALGHRRPRR